MAVRPRARAARAANRLLGASARGRGRAEGAPRSRRGWALSFGLTSLFFLVQTDAERVAVGRWPLLAPWLHTSALPVFAVLAVVVALCWSAVCSWLSDYERYAEAAVARASRLASRARSSPSPCADERGRSAPPLRARFRVAPASPARVTRGKPRPAPRVDSWIQAVGGTMESHVASHAPERLAVLARRSSGRCSARSRARRRRLGDRSSRTG